MGIAAYNRGSRSISRETREGAAGVDARAEYLALADENARLRARVAQLDADIGRARRCLAAERAGREALRQQAIECRDRSAAVVRNLCRIAFPGDFVRCSRCNGVTAVTIAENHESSVLCEGCLFSRNEPLTA